LSERCTGSAGGGALNDLAQHAQGLGFCILKDCFVASCCLHTVQLQLGNAVIASFGEGVLNKVLLKCFIQCAICKNCWNCTNGGMHCVKSVCPSTRMKMMKLLTLRLDADTKTKKKALLHFQINFQSLTIPCDVSKRQTCQSNEHVSVQGSSLTQAPFLACCQTMVLKCSALLAAVFASAVPWGLSSNQHLCLKICTMLDCIRSLLNEVQSRNMCTTLKAKGLLSCL